MNAIEQALLDNNNIKLLEPYTTAKSKHLMKCMTCKHEWVATIVSKNQTFKKRGVSGCPNCDVIRRNQRKQDSRNEHLRILAERGIDVLTPGYDGRFTNGDNSEVMLSVRNNNCKHEFTITAKNLISRKVACPTCGTKTKTTILNESSRARSAVWQETAPEWQLYKSEVTRLTKIQYHLHKSTINPENHPRTLAGTDGYQLDHIVPVRYGFENNIPVELIAHYTNLQMLPWLENVAEGGTLKEDATIPEILREYI